MRALLLSLIAVTGFTVATPPAARAAGCRYPAISTAGPIQSNWWRAQQAAMRRWEKAAIRRHGRAYGRWDYAADGTVSCDWNERGNRVRCRATAAACSL